MKLAFVSVMLASGWAAAAPALDLERTFVTDGEVDATATDGTQLFLGGRFSYIGQRSGQLVLVSPTTGLRDKSVPELGGGAIDAIVPDGDGGYFVAGDLRSAGTIRMRGLAHLTAAGTWDPKIKPSIAGQVYAVACDANKIYVGGSFKTVDGVARTNFAVIDRATGALDSTDLHVDASVWALATAGTTLYVGGFYRTIGGVARSGLARLALPSLAVDGWNPGTDSGVYALAVAGATVYAGGPFTQIGGAARGYVAALDATTGAARAFDARVDNAIRTLALAGGTLYLGGFLTTAGGAPRHSLAAVDATTGAVLPFAPEPNGFVFGLLATPGAIYAAGGFDTIAGLPRRYAAALDPATGAALAWDLHASHPAGTFAVHPRGILVGGDFTSVNGQDRRNLAAIDLASRRATDWKPRTDTGSEARVRALIVIGSTVYIGGHFSSIAGQPRGGLAAVATDGTLQPLRGDLGGSSASIRAFTTLGTTLYFGGDFGTVNGVVRARLAAIDLATGALLPWSRPIAPDGEILAMVAAGGWIYAGGFSNLFTPHPLIALDPITAGPGPEPTNDGDVVTALAVHGNTIYASGTFHTFCGVPRAAAAAFTAGTTTATSWQPAVPPVDVAYALAVTDRAVYWADEESPPGGTSFLRAYDVATGALDSFAPRTNSAIYTLTLVPGGVAGGGAFTYVDGISQSAAAVWTGTP